MIADHRLQIADRQRAIRLVVTVVASLISAGSAGAQQPVDERRPAASDGTVKISSSTGSVRVRGWSRDTVAVSGTLSSTARLELSVTGRETRIRVAVPSGSSSTVASDIEVRVPRSSSVAVRTVGATIDIGEVYGAVDVESQTGTIRVSGSARTVYAESAAGDVELNVASKVMRARAVDGDVVIRGARGYLNVSTVSGNIEIVGREVWETEVTSVSGDITFEGNIAEAATFYAESHSGTVELRLPAGLKADFDVASYGGDVENEFTGGTGPAFSTGGGGAQIKVKSFKGPVRIRKQ